MSIDRTDQVKALEVLLKHYKEVLNTKGVIIDAGKYREKIAKCVHSLEQIAAC